MPNACLLVRVRCAVHPTFFPHVCARLFGGGKRDLVSIQLYPALPRENVDRPIGSVHLMAVVIKIRRFFDYRISSAIRLVGVACADEDRTEVLRLNNFFFGYEQKKL